MICCRDAPILFGCCSFDRENVRLFKIQIVAQKHLHLTEWGDKPWRTAELARRNICVDTKSLFRYSQAHTPRLRSRAKTSPNHNPGNTKDPWKYTRNSTSDNGYKTKLRFFLFSLRFTRRAPSSGVTLKIGVVVLDIVVVGVEAGCVVVRLLVHDEAQSHALLQHVGVQPGEGGAVATVHEPASAQHNNVSHRSSEQRNTCGAQTYLFL